MIIYFKLSMPNVGSWDGKWTGRDNLYAKVINFRGKLDTEKAQRILEKKYYHYNFGDGWSAGINVSQIDAKEANRIRKRTKGFCGYEWMVDSIIANLKIIA